MAQGTQNCLNFIPFNNTPSILKHATGDCIDAFFIESKHIPGILISIFYFMSTLKLRNSSKNMMKQNIQDTLSSQKLSFWVLNR